jgi:hypothetical protein
MSLGTEMPPADACPEDLALGLGLAWIVGPDATETGMGTVMPGAGVVSGTGTVVGVTELASGTGSAGVILAPHLPQNFAPSGSCAPHLGQNMRLSSRVAVVWGTAGKPLAVVLLGC